jgi:ABC-type multidrug transport system ATPase subunit
MSILIIALPRTGSTSLLYKLAKENGLTSLFEPFDNSGRVQYNSEKNTIVKTIICHHPNNFELSKEFDRVILLSRKNLLECAESHAYQTYFSKTKNYNSNNQYYYEEVPSNVFQLCYNDIIKWNEELNKLSLKLNTPITYYEDIYDINHSDRLRKGSKGNIKKLL